MSTRIIIILLVIAMLSIMVSACNPGEIVNSVANGLDNPNPNMYDNTPEFQKINHDLCVAQGDSWCK